MVNNFFKILFLFIYFIFINLNSSHAIWYFAEKTFTHHGWYYNADAARFSLYPEDETCNSLYINHGRGFQSSAVRWIGRYTGYSRGYKDTGFMDESNPEKFFAPSISLRQGYESWMIFYDSGVNKSFLGSSYCHSLHSSPTSFTVPNGEVSCSIFNAVRFCFAITEAPSEDWELYRWLAKIHIAHYGTKSKIVKGIEKGTHPSLLDVVSSDAKKSLPPMLANYKDYRYINLKGLGLENIKKTGTDDPRKGLFYGSKHYKAKFKGQKMICAVYIGDLISYDDNKCRNKEDCLKGLDDLVKCVLLPIGPPPPPYANFIVNEVQINAVYNAESTYTQPKARVTYLVKNNATGAMEEKFINLGAIAHPLKEGDNHFSVLANGTPTDADFSNPNPIQNIPNIFKNFEVTVSSSSICTKLLTDINPSPSSNDFNASRRNLGCFDRGIAPQPILGIEGKGINAKLKVNYDNKIETLAPISIENLHLLLKTWNGTTKNDYIAKFNDFIFSAFRAGFYYNPDNQNAKFKGKKLCSILSIDDQGNSINKTISVDMNKDCEMDPAIATEIKKVFRCDNGQLVAESSKCVDESEKPEPVNSLIVCKDGNQVSDINQCIKCRKPDGSLCNYNEILDPNNNCKDSILTDQLCKDQENIITVDSFRQCKNGEIVTGNNNCNNVTSTIEYEDVTDGKKMCLRGYNGADSQYFVILKDPATGTEKEMKFKQNPKVLMQLNSSGQINFTSLQNSDGSVIPVVDGKNFKPLNAWSQSDLDHLFYQSEDSFLYKSSKSTSIFYRYSNKITRMADPKNPNNFIDTIYTNSTPGDPNYGKPFFLPANQKFLESPSELCIDIPADIQNTRPWSYTLQMPIYYANYDNLNEDDDIALAITKNASIEKIAGGFSVANLPDPNQINLNDTKKNVLLIPTEYYPNNSKKEEGDITIAIADKNQRETRIIPYTKYDGITHTIGSYLNKHDDTKFIKNFNSSVDLFSKKNKIIYLANKNLLDGLGDNKADLFNTSDCDIIEFEIWGGGASSTVDINDNTNSCNPPKSYAGQNGAYAQGRFRIERGTPLRIKVANATGKISQFPQAPFYSNSSSEYVNDSDYSAIWIKEKDATGKDKLIEMVRANSGSTKHYCTGLTNCNLSRNEVLTAQSFNNQIFQLDNGSYIEDQSKFIPPYPSFTSNKTLTYENIAIDKYREVNFSNSCGITNNLLSTLPLSFPIINQEYDRNGMIKKTSLADFKIRGTGNFNEIGTYFYNIFDKKEIDWSKRNGYLGEQDNICKKKLDICYKYGQASVKDEKNKEIAEINDANISNYNLEPQAFPADTIPEPVNDLNLYCPSLGGCYYNSSSKAVSHSGNNGLIKITCKPM